MANYSKELRKNNALRHNEYYGMQEIFDELYQKARNNESFDNLMDIIFSETNIRLAYRNIKNNTGSNTSGIDGKTIKDIENLTINEVVEIVNKIVFAKQGYKPKPVRRKDIPKPNGKTRPLGIPCIWDRLIQQCIKQVMEPICEARFSKHSYGFRPGRSTKNAIAELCRYINMSKCYYIVEFDIKSFFDNVNHSKLIKQIWALGIRDKHLIYLIKCILKAPIKMPDGTLVKPTKGTPQGGIISPLLANIVLNELDWWISSQWELNPVGNNYYKRVHANGSVSNSGGYRAMRNTNLKEMHIIRYADDFRILCKSKKDAENALIATSKWLAERLKLDLSSDKTKIVNVRYKYSDFLGFQIKAKKRRNKYVATTKISENNKDRITRELIQQIKNLQKVDDKKSALAELLKYNSIVMGIHNYYGIATRVNLDCHEIGYKINPVLNNRLKRRLVKTGQNLSLFEKKKYGNSKMLRYDSMTGRAIYPIAYVQFFKATECKYEMTPYTEEGRAILHDDLRINIKILRDLMRSPVYGSIEYADNRISLFSGQYGKCGITGKEFDNVKQIHCHHIIPKELGGTDAYKNLILIDKDIHTLIHASTEQTIEKYINLCHLNEEEMKKVNYFREKAKLTPIKL